MLLVTQAARMVVSLAAYTDSSSVTSISWSPPGTRRALLLTMNTGQSYVWMQVGTAFPAIGLSAGALLK